MKFNERLSALLDERGLRQKQLAAKMGVSEVTVSNWVRDDKAKTKSTSPSVVQIERIAAALDIPPAALMTDSAALRELICDIDGQEDAIRALLALLARIRVDSGTTAFVRDLADIIGKL